MKRTHSAILLLVFPVIIAALSGCFGSKQVDVQRLNKDSLRVEQLETEKKALLTEVDEYKRQIREMESGWVEFDVNCDSAVITRIVNSGCPQPVIDSFLRVYNSMRSTVKRLSDGSVEATGRISAFRYENQKLTEENGRLARQVEYLETALAKATTKTSDDSVIKHKEKKGASPFVIGAGIFLCLLCFICGLFLGKRLNLFIK